MADRFRAITHVLRQEASVSLGLAGRKLRLAVEALRRFDRGEAARDSSERTRLVRNAASALSAYVIQREALGITDDAQVNAEFGITPEIWHSVGVADEDRR